MDSYLLRQLLENQLRFRESKSSHDWPALGLYAGFPGGRNIFRTGFFEDFLGTLHLFGRISMD